MQTECLIDRPHATRAANTRVVLAIVLVSYFMIVLDNSIIFTGLPDIAATLGLSESGLSWVQNAYTLVFGGLLLLGARAGVISSAHSRRPSVWARSSTASSMLASAASPPR
ncbi:hypothetical protein ACFWPX_01795 [Nocardia sp. NPDC058518]|uniref:hypothetical protein n=1 Tax=Nocardia sp. NPDC058518 TaxID=3346534 RepID=UPI00364AEE30